MSDQYKVSFKKSAMDNVMLSIFNCGSQHCTPNHTWGPGARDHYLIHYIVSGKGTYSVNGETYLLHAGDLFLVRPSELITYRADEEDPWEYYWVGFNGSSANQLVAQLPFHENAPIHHCQNTEQVQKALHRIFLSRGTSAKDEMLMIGYLYIFIATLMEEAAAQDKPSNHISTEYAFHALKFIQFNYYHDISIDDIAKSVGVSRSHLYRSFMTNIGKSPIDYLTEYRINEACRLLKHSKMSIAEIAVSVGFFDQFYFSRVFKKHMGVPPSKYLNSLQDTHAEEVSSL